MGTEENVEVIWEELLQKIKLLYEEGYKVFSTNITPVKIEDNVLFLGVADLFLVDWFNNSYLAWIEEFLFNNNLQYSCQFIEGYIPKERVEPKVQATIPAPVVRTTAKEGFHTCDFDHFVVGEENRCAYTGAKIVSETPGVVYNPFYIYGGTGVGKTHLLRAIVHEAKQRNPEANIEYASCEDLLNEYVDALKNRSTTFRKYRNVEMLLVDDVHFLANKTSYQEEFFNLFNTLHRNGKQIILTSDRQPCEIVGLEERLISRFESGLTVEIYPPEYEVRLAILQMFRDNPHIICKLPNNILEFIAANITTNVRRLIGASIRVSTWGAMHPNTTVTIEIAESILSTVLAKESEKKTIPIDDIQKVVATYFNLKINDILGNKRPKNIAEPRMIAMALSRKLTQMSLPEIGDAFGRNHATIINAVKKIEQLSKKSNDFKRTVEQIERQLKRK